jgi:high-affinity iron transporter
LSRVALAAAVLLAGGLAASEEDWTAPPEAATRKNPVPATPEAVAAGGALFQKTCTMCHGTAGKGDGPAAEMGPVRPRDLTDPAFQARATDGELHWKITNGRTIGEDVAMPALGERLPEADRWKLVLFVRSLAAKSRAP